MSKIKPPHTVYSMLCVVECGIQLGVGALSAHTHTQYPHTSHTWRVDMMNKAIAIAFIRFGRIHKSTLLEGKWKMIIFSGELMECKIKIYFLFDAEYLVEFITSFNFSPFTIIQQNTDCLVAIALLWVGIIRGSSISCYVSMDCGFSMEIE